MKVSWHGRCITGCGAVFGYLRGRPDRTDIQPVPLATPADAVNKSPEPPPADPPYSDRPAPTMLRMSAGFIYFYFGFLKFYTDLSPAEMLASQTIMRIWPWPVDAHTVLFWLAIAEVVIGLALLLNLCLRQVLWIFLAHQIGTFSPLFIMPELVFKIAPFSPTMEGQYILKNLIPLSAILTVMMPAVRSSRRKKNGATNPSLASAPIETELSETTSPSVTSTQETA